jgi:hypothetical protein
MLETLRFIVNTIKNDSIIKEFVGNRVFPLGVDITPESSLFPMITFYTISDITRTVPRGARDSIYQIDIWSATTKTHAGSQAEIEQISERIIALLNFTQYRTGYGASVLRWNRQEGGVDLYESDRRIFHKALRFRTWVANVSNQTEKTGVVAGNISVKATP